MRVFAWFFLRGKRAGSWLMALRWDMDTGILPSS
jgi:hypothetical protein